MTVETRVNSGYEDILSFLAERTGLVFPPGRSEAARERIGMAVKQAGAGDSGVFIERLNSSPAMLDDLISELVVGETYFFRDPAQYDFLRHEAIPGVLAPRRPDHVLRVWSAGCASGEEAYSLAILLEEMGMGGRARVLGTDLCRSALVKAREAAYSGWSFRGGVSEAILGWFGPDGNRRRLCDRMRERVRFEYLNLALDTYPSFAAGIWGMDVILCRNVLIYFTREAVRATARRLYDTLAEGGWLLTGPSDPPLQDLAPFETVVTPGGTAYRRARRSVTVTGWHATPAAAAESAPVSAGTAVHEDPMPGPVRVETEAIAPPELDAAEGLDVAARVREMANSAGLPTALREVEEATRRAPLSAELGFLHAVVLSELGRLREAADAARGVLYLDGSLAVVHFLNGTILRRLGDLEGAGRAFRNAHELAAGRPPEEPVSLGDGERAGRLVEGAAAQLAMVAGAARRAG